MKCWICKGPTPCDCVERRAERKTFAEMAAEDPQLLQHVKRWRPVLGPEQRKRHEAEAEAAD